MKNATLKLFAVLLLALCACSSDKNDEPNDRYDWFITKSIYYQGDCTKRWNETLYDKTLDEVLKEKYEFEKCSNEFYKWKFAYQKLK